MRCERCEATEIWQSVMDSADVLWARRVELRGARPRGQEWLSGNSPGFPQELADVAPGYYCGGCKRYRGDVRTLCKPIENDRPALKATVVEASAFDIEGALSALRSAAGSRVGEPLEVGTPRPAVTVPAERVGQLSPAVRGLIRRDVYEHQKVAIEAGARGANVVISTDTASGKSLCYQSLTAHILASTNGTVLYLAPINALLIDQLDAFERFFTGAEPPARSELATEAYARRVTIGDVETTIARYDGTVPVGDIRAQIRAEKPRVVLSTPEMIVRALLPFASPEKGGDIKKQKAHTAWRDFFRNLRLIIVDELHSFRGVFGAHLANVLRRTRRLVHLLGGDAGALQFFCCSATIRDPVAVASTITGAKEFTLIGREQDRSPRYRRVLVPVTTEGERFVSFAKRVLPRLVLEGGARTIAFRNSIPDVQVLAKGLSNDLRSQVVPYCANTNAGTKQQKIRELRDGRIKCVVTTSALELGIDVGSLNASVLLSYPGSIASTWQMLGRAGRNGDGLLVFVAGASYLDEYWRTHADELIGDKAQPEEIVVDPDNTEILQEHLRGAALDHVLHPKRDRQFFGPSFDEAFDALKKDVVEGVKLEDDVWILRAAGEERARSISLRGLGQYKVPVYIGSTEGRLLQEEQVHRAPRTLFRGAIFVWEGEYYRSEGVHIPEIDPRSKKRPKAYAVVHPIERPPYLTRAKTVDETTILDVVDASESDRAGWGRVQVTTHVDGYVKSIDDLRDLDSGSVPEGAKAKYVAFPEDEGPPDRAYRTQGAWFQLPPEVTDAVDFERQGAAMTTAAEALVRAAPLLRFASPGDLNGSVNLVPEEGACPTIHINEVVIGGAGLARRVFERRQELLVQARKLLADCPQCSARRAKTNGCPRCVALIDGSQDRTAAISLLDAWIKKPAGSSRKGKLDVAGVLRELGYRDAKHESFGGMGDVYRATRDGTPVAVKLARRNGHTNDNVAILRAEAERLRQLSHPNVVKLRSVRELGEHIAVELEWIDGGSLDAVLDEDLGSDERVALWRRIVEAVAYLHEEKCVHRDLKPENVLVRGGEPVIVDFGIARLLGKERAATRVAGTEDWWAPEQAKGAKVAPSMDVFALGRLLSWMLMGSLSGRLTGVSKELAAICTKCLAEDPRKRFKDAGELLDALGPSSKRRR